MAIKDIAVIIPTHKAHKTILATLRSIAIQRHVSYTVYIVIDGEDKNEYDYLLNQFKDIDIKILWYEKNGGAGKARQFGIDHSEEPFISFIDADDTYLTALSLYYQWLPFKEDDCMIVASEMWQELENNGIKSEESNMIWLHGNMYRRSYLDKYDIRFGEARINEDVGFNTQCQCYLNKDEKVVATLDPTYLWQWQSDSTVRKDNKIFTYREGVTGYVENKLYSIKRCLERKEFDDRIKIIIISGMIYLFNMYEKVKKDLPKQLRHVENQSKIYYDEIYKLIEQEFIDKAEEDISPNLELKDYKGYVKFKNKLNAMK